MIKTDILIIGAGPTGLFTVFEAGLLKMRCHILDSLAQPGGQCMELYPKKPIYDIPAYPEIIAGDLIKKLLEQIKPFNPSYSLGETALTLDKLKDGSFRITTDKGTEISTKIIAIAGGLGTFIPRKPKIPNLSQYEDNGVLYMIKDPNQFKDKTVIIAGGGDSALDWSIYLSEIAKKVILIHRRNEFRGANESVSSVQKLKNSGKIKVITPAQITSLNGSNKLESVVLNQDGNELTINTDFFIPLFGLIPKLGPIKDWGLEIENNAIKVNNSFDYQTNIEGIYAIGDVNTYPGKLKLILSGFHEAAVMCHSAYSRLNPDKKPSIKYTTVSGVKGFDGSVKEAKKSQISKID
ncbi:MAG: NAD(P)/FAD-dependent oxidoreductase [Cryomorphaceae bacterium]|jgi:thioredoxin reductase (NADPH)|nr:NAD(P)/FAD-dependent oxidoreductase [Cryomorphaceae bacterium]MBT3504137.1 NAD(P)/FAD-dependent oxidoreductase [Cryomorphaceae bacterium]MBT3689023.1 NAD(P)/FAD-dependent oxidoreductase [Cryomorphaceae bacterium]MBT4221725.1 NAD(P)/FAD-dependent oxidoreductase [Cryomorphaceae bacterium]MBT4293050.1 NAD(P)/FAD-dependent oxidoreductase [Cryomorphaceae bacterium]|tara:strand:+ start:2798 stop:3850 length:1053 start_codon:yes stop_codon:yes gene_type:complete